MYCEDVLSELIGLPREAVSKMREEIPPAAGWMKKGDGGRVLWLREGVAALLDALAIPGEKVPGGWWDALEREAVQGVEVVKELVVYRTTGNPGIVLCRDGDAVVRCRVRPSDVGLYQPTLVQVAVLERNGLWRARGLPKKRRAVREGGE
jgi:hypothetical protein